MKARNLGLLAVLAGLSACAGMQTAPANQAVSVQKAVYVVGQDAPLNAAQQEDNSPGASKLMRIYWFLGGR